MSELSASAGLVLVEYLLHLPACIVTIMVDVLLSMPMLATRQPALTSNQFLLKVYWRPQTCLNCLPQLA